jgi:hypothetical protein
VLCLRWRTYEQWGCWRAGLEDVVPDRHNAAADYAAREKGNHIQSNGERDMACAMGEPQGLDIVLVIESVLPHEAAFSTGSG